MVLTGIDRSFHPSVCLSVSVMFLHIIIFIQYLFMRNLLVVIFPTLEFCSEFGESVVLWFESRGGVLKYKIISINLSVV